MSSRVLQNPLSRSLLIHLTLLLLAALYLAYAPKMLPHEAPITIDVIDTAQKYAKKEPDEKARTKQIVRTSEGVETAHPKREAFLSDKSRVVEEEHSAKNSGELTGGKLMNAIPAAPGARARNAAEKRGQGVKLSDLGVKLSTADRANTPEQRQWADSQTGETMRGGQYIQGMKEGEVSALNTREFVFFSYYDRMRKQLEQAWIPILTEQLMRMYKSGRKIASTDYTTNTLVTMNSRGEVARVQLIEESGTMDIDQAALDALNKAGPYPNPPKGLIDANGMVQIRWGFIYRQR